MRLLAPICTALALLALATPGAAQTASCQAQVNGQEVAIDYDRKSEEARKITRREAIFRGPSRLWAWTWGDLPTCNSAILMDALAEDAEGETDGQCLAWVEETQSYVLLPGDRNYRGRCIGVVCRSVNAGKEEVAAVTSAILSGAAERAGIGGGTSTLTTVTNSAGALIMSGSTGHITGTLGSVGSGILGALSSPAALTAGAVTTVVGGGALFVCTD